ncbi:hypothetical protein [Salinibacter altiplanensis]|uniref:hypothetical protein n=1 Tax=Salinibacter altiplanensis TaxID=1803181 RepID=UPI00131A4DB8|nr:hypothetical protein [Salinibacter altiplanensis]
MNKAFNLPQPKSRLDASKGQEAAEFLLNKPEGQRWLLAVQVGNFIVHDGWVPSRENPNDRTVATTLTEDISDESRTSIVVEAMPYDLQTGHEILIQTGDWTNPPLWHDEGYIKVYVDGGVSEGDTTIPIDDGNGNPVTITASTGDRVLSDFQSLWLTHAREQTKAAMQDFMTGFVNAGGKVEGIAFDTETSIPATKGIKHDPRWDDPSMGVDGVSWKEKLAPVTIDEVINDNGGGRKWSAEISHRAIPGAINEAVVDVIQEDFPGASASDYHDSGITESEIHNAPNSDGRMKPLPHIVGTHATWPLYSSIRTLVKQSLEGIRPEGPLPYSYGNSAWATLRYQVKFVRTMVRENDGNVQPWIPYEGLTDSFFNVDTRETKYWEEHLIQMALHTDPNVPLLFWNARDGGGTGGSDEDDLHFNSVLQEVNTQLDGQMPTLVTSENITWTTDAITTAVDLPGKRLWRVTVRRVDPWDERESNTPDDSPINVSLSNGDTVTVPTGEVGFWYETDKNTTLSASFTHPPADNLLPSDDWIDLTSGVWTKQDPDTEITTGVDDPDGGNSAFNVNGLLVSDVLQLEPNTWYAVSFWGRGGGTNAKWWITKEDNSDTYSRGFFNNDAWSDGNWHRTRAQFRTDGTGKARLKFPLGGVKNVDVYRFMLNRGKLAGPYEAPEESASSAQTLVLQKGGNLVSTAVQPSDPDLETVFGDATSALAQVETENGQVFDPDTGTNEIGTWDGSAAYKIYAEAPTSFAVEGTALDSASVSLNEGWNWLPYLDSTRVAIDPALQPIQNELIMVKDETGRVYRPSQGTTQIDSLEPGAAYKILLENPVTLVYPLQ